MKEEPLKGIFVSKNSRLIYLYELQEKKCYFCKRLIYDNGKIRPHNIDHLQPVSKGGKDSMENVVLSCVECNSIKGNMTMEEFMPLLQDIMTGKVLPHEVKEYAKYLELKKKFEVKLLI